MPTTNLNAGDTLVIPITIGTVDTQAVNMFGLAFSIAYDTSLVEEGSARVDFANSWLGVQDTTMIAMYRDDYVNGRIHLGMVRYDTIQRNGYGHLADVIIVIDDHIAKRQIPFVLEFANIFGIDRDEQALALQGAADEILVNTPGANTGINPALSSSIRVFPQPARNVVYVESDLYRVEAVEVFDLQGRLVRSALGSEGDRSALGSASQRIKIELAQLPTGIYMLRIETNLGFVWKKIFRED